jgi:hypothetical protein
LAASSFTGAALRFPQKQFNIVGEVFITVGRECRRIFQRHRALFKIEDLSQHPGPDQFPEPLAEMDLSWWLPPA